MVPAIKIAGDGYLPGIGCPDSKVCPVSLLAGHYMGTQLVVEVIMGAFVEEVKVIIGEAGYFMAYFGCFHCLSFFSVLLFMVPVILVYLVYIVIHPAFIVQNYDIPIDRTGA